MPFDPFATNPAIPAVETVNAGSQAMAPATAVSSTSSPRAKGSRLAASRQPKPEKATPGAATPTPAAAAPATPASFDPFRTASNAGPVFDPFNPDGMQPAMGVNTTRPGRAKRTRPGEGPTPLGGPPADGKGYAGAQITPKSKLDRDTAAAALVQFFHDMFNETGEPPALKHIVGVYGIASRAIRANWKKFAKGEMTKE